MKTRSSRFFVVLLHLLGVPNHHLPSWYYDYLASSSSDRASFYSGIRGVHPHSIVLERLDLRDVGGLDAVEWLSTTESTDTSLYSTQIAKEPFWLQDAHDGQCLGPSGGFSECGDATLWFILRKSTDRKSLRMSGPFGIEVVDQVNQEEPYRYALQIVGNDYLQQGISPPSSPASATTSISSLALAWRQRRQRRRQRDCLVPSKSQEDDTSSLELGSCAQQNTAWSWRVDSQGYLYLPKDLSATNARECLRRTQSSSAILSSCQEDDRDQQHQRLVQFSLVRYHATSNPSLSSSSAIAATTTTTSPSSSTSSATSEHHPSSSSSSPTVSSKRSLTPPHPSNKKVGLPSNRDIAHSHAKGPVMHSPIFEMNLAGRPLLSNIPSLEARKQSNSSPFAALKDSNPILFHSAAAELQQQQQQQQQQQPKKPKGSPSAASSPNPVKLRKMEMNPYIAASKDEKWVDPLTGLEYQTDLCNYLGHDRKEYGRHTLVGVGQYMKTMLKIKVYGIALYVSKRDVLADPAFQPFAGLSSEELRNRPDFYELLRKRREAEDDPSVGGYFDRTIFLKTNMQLSTESMRSSLDADWKMLSDEAKKILINTSMEPRPAEEQMLQEIQRADNPSRCSCSQVAPEELQADPSCCARGIELAFTWRKNGDIEVRLNGRVMDKLPRPDIGIGIFFEYLRLDDPFSPDFIERAVDGFPHLLSPLAQVQGITSSVMQAPPPAMEEKSKLSLKVITGAADVVLSHAAALAGAVQHGAAEAAAHAVHAAQVAGNVVKVVGEEAERKRQDVVKQMVEMSQQNPAEVFTEFANQILAVGERPSTPTSEPEPEAVRSETRRIPQGRFFRPVTSKWFGDTLEVPDEIGPMINPTMNKTILSLVHMYLLLILIVSFPPMNGNRTRFVVRRSCKMMSVSSSESSFLQRIENGRDSMVLLKEKNHLASCLDPQLKARVISKKSAPDSPRGESKYDSDPAAETDAPQRIQIDLSLQERMEGKTTNGFLPCARVSSPRIKGNECASVRSSGSEGSRRKDPKKEDLKKSLSYNL